jgi:type IV pilus assembly protein PilZ
MALFCPSCSKEIEPETTQCPSCNAIYDSDTLQFLKNLFGKVSQEYLGERRRQARIPIAFKVTYSTSKFSAEGYTFDLSLGGLFIKTDEPLKEGETIDLRISFPNKETELEILGEVAWINREELVTPERKIPPGMGVRFLNLSKEHITTLINILRQALASQEKEAATYCPFCSKEIRPETTQCPWCGYDFEPETLDLSTGPEEALEQETRLRREHIRIPQKFEVAYSSSKEFVESYLEDIGLGGLFIKTREPPNKGETIHLEISLPDGGEALRVLGEVIWSIREERVTSERKIPPGMGVKFLTLPTEDRIRLSINILKHYE